MRREAHDARRRRGQLDAIAGCIGRDDRRRDEPSAAGDEKRKARQARGARRGGSISVAHDDSQGAAADVGRRERKPLSVAARASDASGGYFGADYSRPGARASAHPNCYNPRPFTRADFIFVIQ